MTKKPERLIRALVQEATFTDRAAREFIDDLDARYLKPSAASDDVPASSALQEVELLRADMGQQLTTLREDNARLTEQLDTTLKALTDLVDRVAALEDAPDLTPAPAASEPTADASEPAPAAPKPASRASKKPKPTA
ncbi:hypothetical protein [uncultured Methylobacterium sp.]|uniref:hypothetical protein n=1 Tax=uncultured Methylobacterium sp. TaxID=157278 RepID=UPI0035C95940